MSDIERKQTIWRLAIFSILVNGIAWGSLLLGGSPDSSGLGFILWGTSPLLLSLTMRFVTRDWADLGINPAIRKNAGWYLVSLLSFPVVMSLTLLFGVSIAASSITNFSMTKYLQTALTALPIFFLFAIFEEVGWRGYLVPKLTSLGINSYISAGIVGIVWATWHLPYIRGLTWVYSSEDLLTFIPRFYLVCFALSLVYGEIRSLTGTFWPAVLLHAVGNSFGHPFVAEYVTCAAGREALVSVSNGLFMVAVFILLGTAINRWRWKESMSSTSAL